MFRRPLLFILVVLILAAGIGLLAIGAFPPSVTPKPVEQVLPNERFAPR
ncbi:hypothetical protein IAI18_08980 [Acetobacteraceae bacterium H6797]|nr:hypothetical protein [Acetobacteraceae bacterium H6797]